MSWSTVASCDNEECNNGRGGPSRVTVSREGEVPDAWYTLRLPSQAEVIFCSGTCLVDYAGNLPARPREARPHDSR